MVHSRCCHGGVIPDEGKSSCWRVFFLGLLSAGLALFFLGVAGGLGWAERAGRAGRVDRVERAVDERTR